MDQSVGWSGLDHEDSDHARFRLRLGHIVDQSDGFNDEQRTENLLPARKLASALVWERSRLAILDQLQELETSDESKSVVEALFLSLELVTVATGRNCHDADMEREHQLKHHPVVPPTIPDTYVFDPMRDDDKWYIFYLQHRLCERMFFLGDAVTSECFIMDMMGLCLFWNEHYAGIAKWLRYMGQNVSTLVREQNAPEEPVVENVLEENVVGSDEDVDGHAEANNHGDVDDPCSSGGVYNEANDARYSFGDREEQSSAHEHDVDRSYVGKTQVFRELIFERGSFFRRTHWGAQFRSVACRTWTGRTKL